MEQSLRWKGANTNRDFVEDSPRQAKPVASSTLMVSRTEFDLRDLDNSLQSGKVTSCLSACSTTSSLGMLDLEKQSLLSDLNLSQNHSQTFVQEQVAQSLNRFKERLTNVSATTVISDGEPRARNDSIFIGREKSDVISDTRSNKTHPTNLLKSSELNIFENISNVSSAASEKDSFVSGKQAVVKLEADQKENRKQFDSLPVSPINISWNSENIEERESQFSRIVNAKTYSPEEITDVLRNHVNFSKKGILKSVENENEGKLVNFVESMVSKSETKTEALIEKKISEFYGQRSANTSRSKTEFKFNDTLMNRDIKVAIADSTSFSDTFEESCASSVASIHQIAETLRRKSLMSEPRRAIEHLLSIGTKSKYTPSLASVIDVRSDEDTFNGSVVTEHDRTPVSSKHIVNTPSTITCPVTNLKVDPITKKVFINNEKPTPHSTIANPGPKSEDNKKISQTSAQHFHLSGWSPPIDVINSHDRVSEFWKIIPLRAENIASNFTPDWLEYQTEKKEERVQGLRSNTNHLINSFSEVNDAAKPVRRISMSHNVSNVGDPLCKNQNDVDRLNAGILCVGTQAEVIISVENPLDISVKYQIALKSVVFDNKQNFSAVSVSLVADQSDIVLLPNTEKEIKILLTPLVPGHIDLILEFISEQTSFTNIIHQIRVTGELPKVKILEPEKLLMQFGELAQGNSKMLSLRFKNDGSARLPLKLIIYENNRSRMSCSKIIVEPADVFHCSVTATSPSIKGAVPDVSHLRGELSIVLDTSEENVLIDIVQLKTFFLEAFITNVDLFIDSDMPQIITCNKISKSGYCHIKVKNIGVGIAHVTAKISGAHKAEFFVDPCISKIASNGEQVVRVTFNPLSEDQQRKVDIQFCVEGLNKTFMCSVIGVLKIDEMPISLNTPPLKKRINTAADSPNSNSHTSSSNSIGAEGPMELDCTHNLVSWSSVPLHSKNTQTITLRNRNVQKEKLLLSISDTNGTFKFVENESFCREIKLILEPKESRKISVMFMPFVADQAVNGRILIMRQHSLESSVSELRRLVIPLHGIGGKVKLTYSGVFRDSDNRLWITPDSDTFEAKFTVENGGDSVAFLKIQSDDPDDGVSPDEIILLPRESSEISYVLRLSRDRLDLISKRNPQKEVVLAKISVEYISAHLNGHIKVEFSFKKIVAPALSASVINERNTILILRSLMARATIFSKYMRLWRKYGEFENIQRIREKVESLVDMSIHGQVVVDSLADNQSTLNKLWYEGVTEESIGILVSQELLESVYLDSTVVFKDLSDELTIS